MRALGGPVVSAGLPTSPQGPDHLFTSLLGRGGRRMVSEDSHDFRWLAVVHRLSDLRDPDDARHRQVNTSIHQLDDPGELVEVVTLRGPQPMFREERDDRAPKILEPTDAVPEEVLPVVVMSSVDVDLAAPEVRSKAVEHVPARRSLYNREAWLHLPTERRPGVPKDRAAETALSIDEPHNPSEVPEPFLLVFRTSHIVTQPHA